MTEAPKEIYAAPWLADVGEITSQDIGEWRTETGWHTMLTKYIRADIAEAAYKRGLEDAEKIAEGCRYLASYNAADRIRAKIDDA